MKKLLTLTRKHQLLTVALLFMILAASLFSFAQYYVSATAEQRAASRYDHLMDNYRVTDMDVLLEDLAYYQFGGLPPVPGIDPWDQSIGLRPVDWENFPEAMTKNLVGYWDGNVPVYDIYI